MFALLSDSIAEVRRVPSRCGAERPLRAETLRKHFTVWERGLLLNAACFLVDLPRLTIELPLGALTVAHAILDAERRAGHVLDLVAASMAGAPWRSKLTPTCLVCGRLGTWRMILENEGLPEEAAWRYERPENHIPLCRRCVARSAFQTRNARFDLAHALWGLRFEALEAWHRAYRAGVIPPEWDPGCDPLWPAAYGGETWASGSGHVRCAEPRPFYGVDRTRKQQADLERLLGAERAAELQNARPEPEAGDRLYLTVEVPADSLVGALS
jgi:ribosomal protein L40E